MYLLLLLLSFVCLHVVAEEQELVRVDGGSSIYRRNIIARSTQSQRRVYDAIDKFDLPKRAVGKIIYAPFDGRTIITKDKFYVNALSDESQDRVYDSQHLFEKDFLETLNPFFITTPPPRTTMSTRKHEETIIGMEQDVVQDGRRDLLKQLRLVTLPPLRSTPPPPFKYKRRQIAIDNKIGFGSSRFSDTRSLSNVRFPAQPWQIPPRDSMIDNRPLPIMMTDTKDAINPPYPFYGASQAVPNSVFQSTDMPHKHTHVGSFSHNRLVPIIPLAKAQDSQNLDFSIDTPEQDVLKEQTVNFRGGAKTFQSQETNHRYNSEKEGGPSFISYSNRANLNMHKFNESNTSEKLKTFAKAHPHIIDQSMQQFQVSKMHPLPIPMERTLDPNQKLDLCCRKQGVTPICQTLCNFDTFNDKSLTAAFLTNQCPGPMLGKAYDCASSKVDHTWCCQRAGLETFNGGQCMAFCRTHQATPANVFEYLACLQVFESIKGCYRQYQAEHLNIFGD